MNVIKAQWSLLWTGKVTIQPPVRRSKLRSTQCDASRGKTFKPQLAHEADPSDVRPVSSKETEGRDLCHISGLTERRVIANQGMSPSQEVKPASTPIFDFQPLECEEINYSCLCHQIQDCFVTAAWLRPFHKYRGTGQCPTAVCPLSASLRHLHQPFLVQGHRRRSPDEVLVVSKHFHIHLSI